MKIDESKLMAYLYGELSTTEKSEVEKHFQENPDALKEYQEMLKVKSALGKITDKEVIAPPIFMDDEKPVVSLWSSGFVRYAVGIAAAFFIVMAGAKLLGVQMEY
jgi:anti-sigma factor RsiW